MNCRKPLLASAASFLTLIAATGSFAGDTTAGFLTNLQARMADGSVMRMMGAGTVKKDRVSGSVSINFSTWSYAGNNNRIVFRDSKHLTVYSKGNILSINNAGKPVIEKDASAEVILSADTGYASGFKIMQREKVTKSSGADTQGSLIWVPATKGSSFIKAP